MLFFKGKTFPATEGDEVVSVCEERVITEMDSRDKIFPLTSFKTF